MIQILLSGGKISSIFNTIFPSAKIVYDDKIILHSVLAKVEWISYKSVKKKDEIIDILQWGKMSL